MGRAIHVNRLYHCSSMCLCVRRVRPSYTVSVTAGTLTGSLETSAASPNASSKPTCRCSCDTSVSLALTTLRPSPTVCHARDCHVSTFSPALESCRLSARRYYMCVVL